MATTVSPVGETAFFSISFEYFDVSVGIVMAERHFAATVSSPLSFKRHGWRKTGRKDSTEICANIVAQLPEKCRPYVLLQLRPCRRVRYRLEG